MLVLSRKASERIRIGDDITIQIRRIAGNRVTVAIEAPRDVRILRGELEQAVAAFEGATLPEDAEATDGEGEENPRLSLHAPITKPAPLSTPDTSDHGIAAYGVG